jgi:hypothetical protein
MVIRKVSEDVTTLSVPFSRFGLIKIGGRGTLVHLKDGSVAVFSPVALTPEVKETVASMGELKYIAALDIEVHYKHVISSNHPVLTPHHSTTFSSDHGIKNIPTQRSSHRKASKRSATSKKMNKSPFPSSSPPPTRQPQK